MTIRFVLVNTTHPGNIGAAARALKTMGLAELDLVNPEEFPSEIAHSRSAGADDVLACARIHRSLDDALAPCGLVFGASARSRHVNYPVLDPETAAQKIIAASTRCQVAVVLGRERTGLTNDELDRCQYLINIPTNPDYPSLNVASAVQILAYAIRRAQGAYPVPEIRRNPERAVTQEEMRGLYEHLEKVLIDIGFLDPQYPRKLMRRLYRLFYRAHMGIRELNILRGILSAVQEQSSRLDKLDGE